ncbi:MAG: hypothetical protein ABII80_00415 [bacterium]
MEQLKLKTAMVVGTAVAKAWSQAYVGTTPQGQIMIVVSLENTGEGDLLDLSEIGGSILDSIRENNGLKSEEVAGLSEDLLLSVVIVERKENELEVSGRGEGEVYLYRGERLGKIFEGGETEGVMMGTVEAEDIFLVVTKELGEKIEGEKMKKIMSGGVEEIDNLAVLVRGSTDSSRMVGVMGKVEREETIEETAGETNKDVKKRSNKWRDSWRRLRGKIKLNKPLVIRQEKKSSNLWVGIVILVLLVIGVGGGVVKRSRIVKERTYSELATSIEQKIEEAKSVGDLNPARAKDLLTQARAENESYLKNTEDESYQAKANELGSRIEQTEVEVFHKQEVEVKTLSELSLIGQDLQTDSMILDESGNVLMPDSKNARVLGINLEDKSIIKIELGGVGKMREIGEYNKKIYGMVEGGVAQAEAGEKEAKIVIEPDDLWGEITQIGMYGGNVYLLDKQQGEIWKYPVLEGGFGARRRWLATGIAPDLSKVVQMKVEGDIWILTESGQLLRYSRGAPVSFAMEGFPAEQGDKLVDPKAMFVTESEVYVLERGARRVVVFGVDGMYKKQYESDVFKEGNDLVIMGEKGYVLLSDKIVWFEL